MFYSLQEAHLFLGVGERDRHSRVVPPSLTTNHDSLAFGESVAVASHLKVIGHSKIEGEKFSEHGKMAELWKECYRSERYAYSVSSLGRIRNDTRGIILTPRNHSNGYLAASLGRDKQELIHRLVAKAFLAEPGENCEVDHINRNRTDNRLENLRWVSRSQNMMNRDASYISYIVQINRNNKRFRKCFNTLEEATVYRDRILRENPIVPLPAEVE